MSEHTPGRLTFQPETYGRWLSAQEGGSYSPGCPSGIIAEDGTWLAELDTDEDARRLAACWNALAAFTTDEIEAGVDLVRLKQERDTLLAACEAAAALLRRLGGTNYDPEYSELLAAVALAKGE